MTRAPYVPTITDAARNARTYCNRPGYFAITLVKGAPEVALRITHEPTPCPETGEPMDRSPVWTYIVNGKTEYQDMPENPKLYIGREIDQAEYDYLLADRQWAANYAPHLPEAQPTVKADPRTLPPSF